jgi:hypothetical protein
MQHFIRNLQHDVRLTAGIGKKGGTVNHEDRGNTSRYRAPITLIVHSLPNVWNTNMGSLYRIFKKNFLAKKGLSREIKIPSMKNVCWKEEKHGRIPVGVLYSIGRKFRIAMTNIQRPYCFTRSITGIEVEGERWHPFLLRHGSRDPKAMSYSQRKKGICCWFSGYILLVICGKATSRAV